MRHIRRSLRRCSVAAVCLVVLAPRGAPAESSARIGLDFLPSRSPYSLFVAVDAADGRLQAVRYDRYKQRVALAAERAIVQPLAAAWTSTATELAEAGVFDTDDCNTVALSGRGDQFRFRLIEPEGREHRCSGLMGEAPPALRELVSELTAAATTSLEAPAKPAAAYLRASRLGERRLGWIRERGAMPILKLEQFALDIGERLSGAIAWPGEFRFIGERAYQSLRRSVADAYEFVLLTGEKAFQCHVFLPEE